MRLVRLWSSIAISSAVVALSLTVAALSQQVGRVGHVGDGGDFAGGCCDDPLKRLNRSQPESVQKIAGPMYDELLNKSYRDIVLLRIDENPCSSMNCRGMPPATVRKYLDAALGQRQIDDNSRITTMSAQANDLSSRVSIASACIALFSLTFTVLFGFLSHRRRHSVHQQ